jgi:hypothetical protein
LYIQPPPMPALAGIALLDIIADGAPLSPWFEITLE